MRPDKTRRTSLAEASPQHRIVYQIHASRASGGWCGNGRPPHNRVSMFKAYILKAMRNYPCTSTLIVALNESPTIRRLCGWESVAGIPHKSQFSRAFREFAEDDIASKALAECLSENLGRNGAMHASHDSSEIEAREHARLAGDDSDDAEGERVFGMLKDSHGGRTARVRGNKKVFLHLMFGILVIAAQKPIGLAQSIC